MKAFALVTWLPIFAGGFLASRGEPVFGLLCWGLGIVGQLGVGVAFILKYWPATESDSEEAEEAEHTRAPGGFAGA